MFKDLHYRWEWRLKSSPEALWSLISDTDRFNRDAGLPSLEKRTAERERLVNARRRLRLFRFGIPVEWEEEPFEWVRPYRFGVVRRYLSGPVAEMRVRVELAPESGGGTQLIYQVWARPRNLLGLIALPIQIGFLSARAFDQTMRRYDQRARVGVATIAPVAEPRTAVKPQYAPGGKPRLAQLHSALLARGVKTDLVAKLVATIQQADDLTLSRLRPYALADAWGAPRREVLELCLWAVRLGLLEFRWEVLCPLCRGAKESIPTLGDLSAEVHCDTCNIDYTANFDRSVELTFRPNPAIRPIEEYEYCVGGPQLTPHIVAQQLVSPGGQRTLSLPLEEGRYRFRALELRGGQLLTATPEGDSEIALEAQAAGWPNDERRISPRPVLLMRNATEQEQLLILERTAWSDQAVTAAEVTTLQLFRDLFANEALRPGERISVGSLTIVFTDLRGSTRLYREVGDAVAFGRVMAHFDILRDCIIAEGGALVKTIGDAVMAVFVHPVGAVRAILRAQHELANPSPGKTPLQLKAGIHYGPCIAVRLNERLDYFGSTVNFAARLESLSTDDTIIISPAVRNDPEVVDYLTEVQSLVKTEPVTATVRGFEEENMELWRVSLKTARPRLETPHPDGG